MTPEVFLFHKKFSNSTLTKHVGESHFLAVHDGNIRGAHALILLFTLEREDAANGSITLVMTFPTNSS